MFDNFVLETCDNRFSFFVDVVVFSEIVLLQEGDSSILSKEECVKDIFLQEISVVDIMVILFILNVE